MFYELILCKNKQRPSVISWDSTSEQLQNGHHQWILIALVRIPQSSFLKCQANNLNEISYILDPSAAHGTSLYLLLNLSTCTLKSYT